MCSAQGLERTFLNRVCACDGVYGQIPLQMQVGFLQGGQPVDQTRHLVKAS